jgi:hypothetical protein
MEDFSDQTISSGGGVWGTIVETLLYLQQNAWTIVFALGGCYLAKVNGKIQISDPDNFAVCIQFTSINS